VFNNEKSDEEKLREHAAIQDSSNIGKMEAQALSEKQQEKEDGNKLFDVEGARQRIKQGLLGFKQELRRFKTDDGDVVEKNVAVSTREKQLCNKEGAGVFMDEANSFLNHNTISTYLPADTIENKCKGTLKPLYKQIFKNFHKFDINGTEDAEDIISIIRNPMIDATNKARGGRLIDNQEQIRVEKESISREGGKDEDDDENLGGLF